MADGTATIQGAAIPGRRQIGTPGASNQWVEALIDWTAAAEGSRNIITPVGVNASIASVAVGGSTTKFYTWHDAHAIGGIYETLDTKTVDFVTDNHSCTTGPVTLCDLRNYATVAGDMTGDLRAAAPNMNWQTRAFRSEVDTDHDYRIELRFYHRTSGGTETLINTSFTADITETVTNYTGTWSVSSDQTFNSTDLLVVKYRFDNQGTGA